jgi:hypothetical protein
MFGIFVCQNYSLIDFFCGTKNQTHITFNRQTPYYLSYAPSPVKILNVKWQKYISEPWEVVE